MNWECGVKSFFYYQKRTFERRNNLSSIILSKFFQKRKKFTKTNKQTNSLDGGLKNSVSFLGLKAHKSGLNRLFYQYYFLIELRKRY